MLFYLPYRPLVQETVETIKLREVYDASSKPRKGLVSII